MAFVKLDCGMLDSTTWFDKDVRDIFITALLMASPKIFDKPQPQIEINTLDGAGWSVPAGWYGFVDAASLGIIHRCGVSNERGLKALERLDSPELESRSQAFDGRRMVRIDGGFVILNYIDYREKDHTAAKRQRRFREKQKAKNKSNAVTSRYITQAEAEAEAEAENIKPKGHSVTKFNLFWAAYPKKVGKKPCQAKWKARNLDCMADQLIADVKNRIENDDQWRRGFIPNPATYLNQDRWEDEVQKRPTQDQEILSGLKSWADNTDENGEPREQG